MTVSSNALFHFTDSFDNLINILKKEFRPHFCLEYFSDSIFRHKPTKDVVAHAIPMNCFCDLPLSNIKVHLVFFGEYGLGLTKTWGMKKGISPVMYIYPKSHLAKYIENIIGYIFNNEMRTLNKNDAQALSNLYEFIGFIKPYKGLIDHKGKRHLNKRFYDEREWRYVPNQLKDPVGKKPYRLSKNDFLDNEKRDNANEYVEDFGVTSSYVI